MSRMIRLQADAGRVSVLHVYTPTVTTASTEVPESGLELAWVIANACVCLLCLHRCFRIGAGYCQSLCLPFVPAQVFQSASETDTFVPAGVSECKCLLCLQVFQSASETDMFVPAGVSECKCLLCLHRCFRVQARPIRLCLQVFQSASETNKSKACNDQVVMIWTSALCQVVLGVTQVWARFGQSRTSTLHITVWPD